MAFYIPFIACEIGALSCGLSHIGSEGDLLAGTTASPLEPFDAKRARLHALKCSSIQPAFSH
jgi:hypothetical protein